MPVPDRLGLAGKRLSQAAAARHDAHALGWEGDADRGRKRRYSTAVPEGHGRARQDRDPRRAGQRNGARVRSSRQFGSNPHNPAEVNMADNLAEIRQIFADNGVPLVRDDVWQVQSATVVKHKALERLAVALKIRWSEPKILRAERDEAVILVTGAIGDHMEWSIGEALIVTPNGVGGNYKVSGKQASYVFAMSEKRGKDRVILKLAGIDAYSEEESDDFRERPKRDAKDDAPDPTEFLRSAEKSLAAAALLGSASLIEAWKSLPQPIREGFGGLCPPRFKQIATDHDAKREAA